VQPIKKEEPKKATAPAPAKTAAPSQPRNSAWGQQIPAGAGVATGNMVWPSRGVITTYFGQGIWYGVHAGLDIASGCGTPILAADGGTVVMAAWDGGYGNSVLLDHGNGIRTRYAHFRAPAPVGVGARVNKGQVIGYEGTTGNSTGCHLHFEVIQGGGVRNPLNYLP
jgi:murein DD-endopeptidase MepM/ murein hydrolase activator NlpD